MWAASTMAMGFVGGFAVAARASDHARDRRKHRFSREVEVIARHVPPERRGIANAAWPLGIALGPAVGTLAGGLIVAELRLARRCSSSSGWRPCLAGAVAATCVHAGLSTRPTAVAERDVPIGDADRQMAVVVDGDRPLRSAIMCFYFLLAWLPLYLVQSRGLSISEMTVSRDARLSPRRRSAALGFGAVVRLVDALGPVRGRAAAAG